MGVQKYLLTILFCLSLAFPALPALADTRQQKIDILTKLISLLKKELALLQPRFGGVQKFGALSLTDYKFWYIMRNDQGQILEAAVRIYEGAITTEPEFDIDTKTTKNVTRYRRIQQLPKTDIAYATKFKKDVSGHDAIIYQPSDFGVIYTDDELRTFLDKELAKDKTRTPIAEQVVK